MYRVHARNESFNINLFATPIGPSKKLAKNAAAKSALSILCDISYSPMQFKTPTENAPIENDKKQTYELPQPFADAIGR